MSDIKHAETLGSMDMPLQSSTTPSADGKCYFATLIRGELHYYHDKFFKAGEPILVTEEEKLHLEEHAVDNLSVGDEEVFKVKFKFEEYAKSLANAGKDVAEVKPAGRRVRTPA